MSIGVQIDQVSLDKLKRTMTTLDDKMLMKVVTPAMRAAARPVTLAARAKAPVRTRLLRKSIGVRVKTYRKNKTAWVGVGPRKGFKTQIGTVSRGPNRGQPIYANPTQYAHLIERGTSRVQARPFLRPAIQSTTSQQLGKFTAKARAQFGKLKIRER